MNKVIRWIKINLLDGCPNCGKLNKRFTYDLDFDYYRCSCGTHYEQYKHGW